MTPSLRAQRSNPASEREAGLLLRLAPCDKRFAFVAGNDGVRYSGMPRMRRPSRHCQRSEAIQLLNHKAGLLRRLAPSANASRLSQAMTECVITGCREFADSAVMRAQRSNPASEREAGLLRRLAPR